MLTNSRTNRKRVRLLLLSAAIAPLISLNIAHAEKKSVLLHSFSGGTDGGTPGSGVIRAADGTLYGTTEGGGENGAGTIYKITPDQQEVILYSFQYCCTGANPTSEPTLDAEGNLYGTTCCTNYSGDQGVVWKLTPDGIYTVLHDFNEGDEIDEGIAVAVDKKGSVYGVTFGGGANGDGVVYKISPKGRYKVLHAFDGADGNSPSGTPLLDKDGNIFGTTQQGGQNGFGTIYELTPHGIEKVLYSFTRADGISPYPGVVRDDEGNLYGTTQGGGANNYGTLFKFSPAGALTVLHAFGPAQATVGDVTALQRLSKTRKAKPSFTVSVRMVVPTIMERPTSCRPMANTKYYITSLLEVAMRCIRKVCWRRVPAASFTEQVIRAAAMAA
jgi:uncharacterized repeat protein (TIGR03803 family)